MDEITILPEKVNLIKSHRFHFQHPLRTFFLIVGGVVLAALVAFGVYAYQVTKTNIVNKENQAGFFGQIKHIIDNSEPLAGEEQDRINVLLLGQGGKNHDGGTLADTIMVASIRPSTHHVGLLSIPRDLVVPFYTDEKKNKRTADYLKINNTTAYGGAALAMEKVEEITGLQMHYYVLIDFEGFRDIVNTLGGIDVTVDQQFTDYEYPDYTYGYQTISFTQGEQHMDGERALQFARSRHGTNGEGSDFARSKRQQKILEAFQRTLLSASTLLNPAKLTGMLNDVGDHVSTNMEIWEMLRFAALAKDIQREDILTSVIDNGNVLVSEKVPETGAYILVPRAGLANYSEIKKIAKGIFDRPPSQDEKAHIAIQNGTTRTGLASATKDFLESEGLIVNTTGNARVKTVTATMVYDLSGDQKPETRDQLSALFGLPVVTATLPPADSAVRVITDLDPNLVNVDELPNDVDFVLVIGTDFTLPVANNSDI